MNQSEEAQSTNEETSTIASSLRGLHKVSEAHQVVQDEDVEYFV